MKFPFIRVPDFHKQVEDEPKPDFYHDLSKQDQEDYKRNLIFQRSLAWSCETAASAYNLVIVGLSLLILTNGLQLMGFLQKFISKMIGLAE